jgi:hypothetical protein
LLISLPSDSPLTRFPISRVSLEGSSIGIFSGCSRDGNGSSRDGRWGGTAITTTATNFTTIHSARCTATYTTTTAAAVNAVCCAFKGPGIHSRKEFV